MWQNKIMDIATTLGLLIGFGGILLGNLIEGGHVGSLMQLTAGIIVLAGTIGAVMVSNTMNDIKLGVELLRDAFFEKEEHHMNKAILEILDCARVAKKESILALESKYSRIENQFFKKILRNLIDGIDSQVIREIFEIEIESEEQKLMNGAKVWMDAGGYSPTIGIIGAVLGLIHVMGNLSDTSKLGAGIAVAFVATVYGVSLANLVFLPLGNKIRKRIQTLSRERQLILEGALMIATEANTSVIDQKLRAYLVEQ